jgi:polyvinyl alcohol dehydrogenase (cytochrome)
MRKGLVLLGAIAVVIAWPASASGSVPADSWPTYLGAPDHSSASDSTGITAANLSTLHVRYSRTMGVLQASPTVYANRIYLGSLNGNFYAINLSTNALIWKRFLGKLPAATCSSRGITSTATVAPDPVTGALTLYVGGGDGYLYALNAADGSVVWKTVVGSPPSATQNDYYNWSSPAVYNGKVYDGVSSQCDNPFVPGGVMAYDQATGQLTNSYMAMPDGYAGGGVWTSVAIENGSVWATIGSTYATPYPQGDSYSIVSLDAATLARQGIWTVPNTSRGFDADFGASPTMFTATLDETVTRMIGACDKNGFFYAFRADDVGGGPVWSYKIGKGQGGAGAKACLDAAIWDGSHLFIGGNATTIQGILYNGSMRELDPSTGQVIWETGLPANILGTPSINAAGVIAASTYDLSSGATNGTYLIDAATGTILNTLVHAAAFPQPVFVGSNLIVATQSKLMVYSP